MKIEKSGEEEYLYELFAHMEVFAERIMVVVNCNV